ncbi:UvrD-helicase domain-containing protein [Pseudomonas sp. B8(2017)]|uniref:UvrD-helicase domain-containing protein n=1 Tax=Pseudomonas sp. B8(2017) TaxID=1981711 RepID=UPI000A1FDB92|nr:UvrD-helicase domain-containing protein [Pseudomonas sp. B8(2017)]
MSTPEAILALSRQAVIAPAGHGKTELIAKAVALGRRTLVLTHTHAGVHAIRARLKRLLVPSQAVSVDTIASWACRYVQAFPRRANQPPLNPRGRDWDAVYLGALAMLTSPVVQRVIRASYDRILIDEYQDCEQYQHAIAMQLSSIVPTVVFGDPMQGIFEFVPSRISWAGSVENYFSHAYELQVPHRWTNSNPALGDWIAQTRLKLQNGQAIDLRDGPLTYVQSSDPFDMSLFFDGMNERVGSTAAIYCWRNTCNELAKVTRGAYQSIEEIAAQRLIDFASAWDAAQENPHMRGQALRTLLSDVMTHAPTTAVTLDATLPSAWHHLCQTGLARDALEVIRLERAQVTARAFRGELLGDARRAISDVAASRHSSMVAACEAVRHRLSIVGRAPVARTISTPLLLKGLEFDHVLIPDANHFVRQQFAAAKLFYVAISRARHSLTISSRSPILQFPVPNL